MTEYIKPPPIGSDLMTQLIDSNLPRDGASIDVVDLSQAIRVQRFYVMQHLWELKLTNRSPGVLSRITGIDFSNIPLGMRKALASRFPEMAATLAPAVTKAPPKEAQPKQEQNVAKKKRPYGSMRYRIRELVEFVRAHKPMTVDEIAHNFEVDNSTIRRYLYAMIEYKKNLDVPRRVSWNGHDATEAPAHIKAELKAHPIVMEDYPDKSVSAGTKISVVPEPAKQETVNVVRLLEAEALKAIREGDVETATALGVAINAVEKKKSV